MENETSKKDDNVVNIHMKIQQLRVELQDMNLKKSGYNKFAGFSYYTLEDIAPAINRLLLKHKLVVYVTFSSQEGLLQMLNAENSEEKVTFRVPVKEAEQRACNSIQNLGATITYLRRYLYLIAFDIVEYDTFDSVLGRPGTSNNTNPTGQDVIYAKKSYPAATANR